MKTKELTIFLVLISLIYIFLKQPTQPAPSSYEIWKSEHGVSFTSELEDKYRSKMFEKTLDKITTHNSDPSRTYDMGLNQFSALSQSEFVHLYLGLLPSSDENHLQIQDTVRSGDVDWRESGAVTNVKNQGQCGSCWAFAATGGLQGLSKITDGKLQQFSEQHLLDCSSDYGNYGCGGGLMTYAYHYVKDHGIMYEADYPYVAHENTCKISGGPYKIKGYTQLQICDTLSHSLMSHPISVSVDGSSWPTYSRGIFDSCGKHHNHGVTLIGMTNDYWIVKNSWGTKWGEDGYIRLKRGNTCGICTDGSFPKK